MKRAMIGAAALLTGLAGGLPTLAQTPPVAPRTVAAPAVTDARLARVLADYEAYLRAKDPITAGLDGDREADRKPACPTCRARANWPAARRSRPCWTAPRPSRRPG